MGSGRRRAARRICLAGSGVCAVLSLALPARAQDEALGAVPEVFRGAATSMVASVEADRDALLPVDDVFRFVALDGSSVYETDLQTARASLLFPGNGLILGPNLACGTFGGQFPESFAPIVDACLQYEYPLSVKADATEPDLATDGSLALGAPTDPVSGRAISAVAHAAPDGSTTDAVMQDLRVLGLPAFGPVTLLPTEELELDPTILTVSDATSRTVQHVVDGVLTIDAESVMTGVSLVGGLVRIGSLRSTSRVTDDAAGTRTADSALEVTGVTVGGVPAQITDQGLVLGSPSGTGPLQEQLQGALNRVLEALNVQVTLLGQEEVLDDGTGQAVASVGGLLVEVAADAQGLPTVPSPVGDLDPNGTYVGSVQLGATAASGAATNFELEPLPDLPIAGDVPFDAGGSTFDGGALDVAAPVASPASPPAGDAAREELVRSLTDTFGGRMGLAYLAAAFAVLGLCVAPFSFPARFPGSRA